MAAEAVGPFALDLDPESLREAARRMRSMARDFAERGAKLRAMPDDVGQSWTGSAARSAKTEMRGLASHLGRFAEDMGDSRSAVRTLAEHYDEALRAVESLNRRWEQANERYTASVARADRQRADRTEPGDPPASEDPVHRQALQGARTALEAEQGALWKEFEDLRVDVRRRTRTCATALSREVPLPVDPDAVTLYRHYRWTGLRPERDDFTETLPLSRTKDHTDPIDPTEGQDEEDREDPALRDANKLLFDFTLDAAGRHGDAYRKALATEAELLRAQERRARRAQYERRGTPAGRRAARDLDDLTRRVGDVEVEMDRRALTLVRRLPWVGQAAGVGMDVHDVVTGKEEVGKVVLKSGSGLAAGAVAVAVASGPLGWGALGVAAAGVGAAYLVSEGVGALWDQGVVQSAGKGIASGAKKAWKAVFG